MQQMSLRQVSLRPNPYVWRALDSLQELPSQLELVEQQIWVWQLAWQQVLRWMG